jgi:hypothetical protein
MRIFTPSKPPYFLIYCLLLFLSHFLLYSNSQYTDITFKMATDKELIDAYYPFELSSPLIDSSFRNRTQHNSSMISPQCLTGYVHYNVTHFASGLQLPQCIVRGTQDRDSLNMLWELSYHLITTAHHKAPPPVRHPRLYITLLLNILISIPATVYQNRIYTQNKISHYSTLHSSPMEVTNLIFLGDSVSIQFAIFLRCDMERAGIFPTRKDQGVLMEHNFPYHMTEYNISLHKISQICHLLVSYIPQSSLCHNATAYDISKLPSHFILRIYDQQFNPPFLRDAKYFPMDINISSAEKPNRVYTYVIQFLEDYSSTSTQGRVKIGHKESHNNIIIFNYGLHLRRSHRHDIVPGISKALIDFATNCSIVKENSRRKTWILFRETSAQAFSATSGMPICFHI